MTDVAILQQVPPELRKDRTLALLLRHGESHN
jgi:hypothetical protein